jgi:hypothetical protein
MIKKILFLMLFIQISICFLYDTNYHSQTWDGRSYYGGAGPSYDAVMYNVAQKDMLRENLAPQFAPFCFGSSDCQ